MSAVKQYNRSEKPHTYGATDHAAPFGLAETGERTDAGVKTGPRELLTGIDAVPITKKLPPPSREIEKHLESPYLPRALVAADVQHPKGSPERAAINDKTVLQQHCEFFDLNGDGAISMHETFLAFRSLGYNVVSCIAGMLVINLNFSWFTCDGYLPDPYFRVFLKNIHRTKHGSDTGVYDHQGRFVPAHFEQLFSKYDKTDKGGLSWSELVQMGKSQRNPLDFFGMFAFVFEWSFTWFLVADVDNNILRKEHIRRMYDGTLFYAIAEDRQQGGKTYKRLGLSFGRAIKELINKVTGSEQANHTVGMLNNAAASMQSTALAAKQHLAAATKQM